MATIYYSTLNKNLKRAINSKTISEEDLRKIYTNLKENLNRKKKTMNIVMIIIIVMFIMMGIPTVTRANNPEMTKFFIMLFVPVIAIIYGIVYFTQFGLIKIQFNKAIKNNYPELSEKIKL